MIRTLFLVVICSVYTITHASPIPPAPNLNVKAYVIMDYDSKMILASSNKDLTLPPASITKMMTAYVAFTEFKEKTFHLMKKYWLAKKHGKQAALKCLLRLGKK